MTRVLNIAAGVLAVSIIAGTASAQRYIVGSEHDFSTTGWANGEICLPCHTPHHAMSGLPRLWNHELTVATYTMHEGTGTAVDDFDIKSRLCLSCHDGTVALDSFGGQAGTVFIGGGGLIGTDLTDDHPVGSDALYPPDPKPSWWDGAYEPESNLPFGFLENWEDPGAVTHRVVSCATCHTPHAAGGYDAMLVMSNNASALCLTCHIK